MPRTPRKQSETGILHVMLRGINRESIFQEEEDYRRFLSILAKCKALCGFELFAWCLMDNHVHLLIRAGEEPLATVMKRIGCRYVYWYNHKYDRIGHLFQDRYRSESVETDAYFLTALRYILQNPLKAGLERHLGEYPYTSYWAYAGRADGLTDTAFGEAYFPDRDAMLAFLTARADDKAMDVEPERAPASDLDVRRWLATVSGCREKGEFKALDRTAKRSCVQELLRRGATIRQIAEATGLPKSNIGRLAE